MLRDLVMEIIHNVFLENILHIVLAQHQEVMAMADLTPLEQMITIKSELSI